MAEHFDDMSSLGADTALDMESQAPSHASPVKGQDDLSLGQMGDIDEEDLKEDEEQYFKDHEMIVDGLRCPDEFIKLIAPMEFEEMVHLFRKFDASGTGAINRHETKKILHFLGMDASQERAEELLQIVDTDGSGEIDFDEFCNFIVMIKKGDERLGGFGALLEKLNDTPLGQLEQQAASRQFQIRFQVIEERPATLTAAPIFVVELHLKGTWYRIADGEVIAEPGTKKFQGLGATTRDAKYAAASAAFVNLGQDMPGVRYPEGTFPDEWMEWLNDNLLRGIDQGQIASILVAKGFHPYKNTALMHKIILWKLLDKFCQANPEKDLNSSVVNLDEDFRLWLQATVDKGLDGEILINLLLERCIDLAAEHPLLAQQLKNNQLGSMMGLDGRPPAVLDFWHACKMGYVDEVVLYCKSNAKVDEETQDRHTTERMTPLMLSASGGHTECCRVLLKFGAQVNLVNRRGRSALHCAANKGYHITCEVLIDAGGRMFAGDHQGNTPLHLAAMGNHLEATNFLAWKGQDLTRVITSDKVRPCKHLTFEQLTVKVFQKIADIKLTGADTNRVEKEWLNECANLFISMMDKDVNHMLAPSNPEIMLDVLSRFDPRPESGIFISDSITAEQIFVKTVPSPTELSHLLRLTFRQSCVDAVNRWKRTALHTAADANNVDSHWDVLQNLIDIHGCNVTLRDMHNCKPLDLLIKDKVIKNMPTATQAREETLINARELRLDDLFDSFDRIDKQRQDDRRALVLKECRQSEDNISTRMWHCIRKASLPKKKYDEWEVFEDPDTGNYFYSFKAKSTRQVNLEEYTNYDWQFPSKVLPKIYRIDAINYLRRMRCSLLRLHGEWEAFKDMRTDVHFFYNTKEERLQFRPPKELTWHVLTRAYTRAQKKLGYASEWEVYEDPNGTGNCFYRNKLTRFCVWERPIDAIEISPSEMLCSAHQHKGKGVEQRWYSCEQCNRAWKTNATGDNASKALRICEPCVFRCHKGHKGVRFMRTSPIVCLCGEVCKVTNSMCNACVISDIQLRTQGKAHDQRREWARIDKMDVERPPILAAVPKYGPDGHPKSISGWMICRLCQPQRGKLLSADGDDGSVGSIDSQLSHDDDTNTPVHQNSSLLLFGSTSQVSFAGDMHNVEISPPKPPDPNTADASEGKTGGSLDGGGGGSVVVAVAQAEEASEYDEDEKEDFSAQAMKTVLLTNSDYPAVEGLPAGWVEVYDPEEPAVLNHGEAVKVLRLYGIPHEYGKVRFKVKGGAFYRIRYDDPVLLEEVVERSHIELLDKRTFFFNVKSGQCAWTKEEALNDPKMSASMHVSGPDWEKLLKSSVLRRAFDGYDEMHNLRIDQVFYVDQRKLQALEIAKRLQIKFRHRHRYPRPAIPWEAEPGCFSFDMPDSVKEAQRWRQAWAYLRRRSVNVGEFRDEDGETWEEYMDNKTAEYFYWDEENNRYQWDKPPLYVRKIVKNTLNEGDVVMYRFPGSRKDAEAIITKVRFDDETGDDMYDIEHKYTDSLAFKWVARHKLKKTVAAGEDPQVVLMEAKWKNQIRKKREKDERDANRARELRVAAELARLEAMKSMAYKMGLGATGGDSGVSQTTRLMRARQDRIALEAQDIKEKHDEVEGAARRQIVIEKIAEAKKNAGDRPFTRGDELNLTRTLTLKMALEDKIKERDEQQAELLAKREENEERAAYVEEELRDHEELMTTPRSLIRRQVVRTMHISMKRQQRGFMICEWGCHEWFKVGKDQIDHQLRRCPKRIIGCTLGCPLKHKHEVWLQPAKEYLAAVRREELKAARAGEEDYDGTDAGLGDDESSLGSEGSHESDIALEHQTGNKIHSYGNQTMSKLLKKKRRQEYVDKGGVMKGRSGTAALRGITYQQHHETEECPKRLVVCPKQCLEWVCFEVLEDHLLNRCTKRPAKPLECRQGCGAMFGGMVETLIQAEDDRLQHEQEECIYRIVRCNWVYDDGKICAAQMKATERTEHRDYHLTLQGVRTYTVAGTYIYKINQKDTRLKIQMWGAGGGGGFFKGRNGGKGGGGAFIEAIVDFEPYTVLELIVGEGGNAGVVGSEVQPVQLDEQRRRMRERLLKEKELRKEGYEDADEIKHMVEELSRADAIATSCGSAAGGTPGGGFGYGGGGCWASGGGGGYTIISKCHAKGNQALFVAGGGGGGGSLDGLPGGGMDGPLHGTLLDSINGCTATVHGPGNPGDSGSTYNAAWPATAGEAWQGGHGCEFGAGGGGGYFGGGGGGTNPGLSGGGGGGSSYIYLPIVLDHVCILGHGQQPGGLDHNPPSASGVGEWDKVGGFVGQGGDADPVSAVNGRAGGIRIIKPGHY